MQDDSRGDGTKICKKLEQLITEYNPDVFGLNEVIINRQTKTSPLLELLKKSGYHIHFASFGAISAGVEIGSVFASRKKVQRISEHPLGNDTYWLKRDWHDFRLQLVEANIDVGGTPISVFVNHFVVLRPGNWRRHLRQREKYHRLIKSVHERNVIIGGDFNEFKWLLSGLDRLTGFQRKTGTFLNPTWRWNGQKRLIVRANYDNIFYKTSSRLNLKHFRVLDMHPSDHAPLLAVFSVQ